MSKRKRSVSIQSASAGSKKARFSAMADADIARHGWDNIATMTNVKPLLTQRSLLSKSLFNIVVVVKAVKKKGQSTVAPYFNHYLDLEVEDSSGIANATLFANTASELPTECIEQTLVRGLHPIVEAQNIRIATTKEFRICAGINRSSNDMACITVYESNLASLPLFKSNPESMMHLSKIRGVKQCD